MIVNLFREKSEVVQQTCDGLAVADDPFLNHLFQFLPAVSAALDFLVFLWLRYSFSQAFSQQNKHFLFQKSWSRKEVQENPESFRTVSRFFHQLAFRRFARTFAFINAARD